VEPSKDLVTFETPDNTPETGRPFVLRRVAVKVSSRRSTCQPVKLSGSAALD
jgi:hypothetical protein